MMNYKLLLKRKVYTRRELTEVYERSFLDEHAKEALRTCLRSNAIHMLNDACKEQHIRFEEIIPFIQEEPLEKFVHSYATYNNFINLCKKWVSLTITRYKREQQKRQDYL